MLFDTHAHFPVDRTAAAAWVARAAESGVDRILAVGGNPELNAGALAAAQAHPRTVLLALGCDRDQAPSSDAAEADLDRHLAAAAAAGLPLAALGEMGLDYHHTPQTRAAQLAFFERQLARAARLLLPVIVHTREADADTLAVLRNAAADPWFAGDRPGVIHCFTGTDPAFADGLLALGYALSFSGIVTFANAAPLRAIVARVPADRLLIETDAPYLAPVPLRGRPNEPAFVAHVAACVAAQRGVTPEAIAALTAANARRLFDVV